MAAALRRRVLRASIVLLVAVTNTALTVSASPIAFESLTWSEWRELHDASAAALALERVYREGPRVRAKLRVAAQLSMNQFLAGDAIFRQQLSRVAGTSAARVQLEFLQTSALRESAQGEVFAAFGISALPDPTSAAAASDSSATIGAVIDEERERIIQRLRHGGANAQGLNATVSALTLFGVAATLVDVALDGEAFYPIDLKPWIAARLAVVPSVRGRSSASPASGGSSSSSSSASFPQQLRYSPSANAYQSLRLRFLIATTLKALHVESSDVLLRESAPPFASYYSDAATVVEAEIHVSGERFRAAVDGHLRNASFAQAFSALEPQWTIAAIDVDALSGILYSPPATTTSTSTPAPAPAASTSSAAALELTFALENVSFASVDSRKWRVLEQFARFAGSSGCGDCHVGYARVAAADASAALRSGGDVDATALDPINARSLSLVFSVATAATSLAPGLFTALDPHVAAGASPTLCELIGVGALDEEATCALAAYRNASSQAPGEASSERPFVQLNLTLALTASALAASTSARELAASAFTLHRVRCVLLVLLQQVAVFDEHVRLVSSAVLAARNASSLSLPPPIQLVYRVAIRDESQRRGVARLFLSKRFELTVSEYTQQLLRVAARAADLHADGSPSADDKLPGFAHPLLDMTAAAAQSSAPIASSGSATTASQLSVYRFGDPVPATNATTAASTDPSNAPRCSAATNGSAVPVCLSVHFASAFEGGDVVFLRQITSNAALSSPSLELPPLAAPAASATVPGPWIQTRARASVPWILYATLPPASSSSSADERLVVLRFRFEFAASANASESDRQQTAFDVDVRVEPDPALGGSSETLVVRKDSFQPLVAGGGRASLYANPFVIEQLPDVSASDALQRSTPLAVALTIHRSSVGGFFTRDSLAQCTACSSVLQQCDASVECKALAACVGSYANANPALYASLLRTSSSPQAANATVSLDTSQTLQWCVHHEQRWNSSTLALFLGGLRCASTSRCAVMRASNATVTTPSRAVVLRHSPLEQTLAFAHDNFSATLLLSVNITSDTNDTVTTRSATFSNLTRDDASLSALSQTLMQLYGYDGHAGYGGDALLTSFVSVSRVDPSSSDSADTVLRIRYFSLSLWNSALHTSTATSAAATATDAGSAQELPVIRTLSGDAPRVAVAQATEQLELQVTVS